MERFWNQPYSHQQWKLLLKEQENLNEMFHEHHQNSLQRLRNFVAFLAQVILEKQGVPNPSHVASQLFDIIPEIKEDETLSTTLQVFDEMSQRNLGNLDKQNKLFDEKPDKKPELADFSFQGKTEEITEHIPDLMQTTVVEALELQTEKVTPNLNLTYSVPLPCSLTDFELEPQTEVSSYHPTEKYVGLKQNEFPTILLKVSKPQLTFRSPINSTHWTQSAPHNLKPHVTFKSPITTSSSSYTHSQVPKRKFKLTDPYLQGNYEDVLEQSFLSNLLLQLLVFWET
ncbi:hypothetical protein M5689_011121 [Euphorbia peplus]|nr:hypothetical protein M5689_011121 [Euphorbia peplus]